MRAIGLHIAHEAQRKSPPQAHYPSRSADGPKLARRVVAGCVTVLMILAAVVALPMPIGG
jgi:hypothetical protein